MSFLAATNVQGTNQEVREFVWIDNLKTIVKGMMRDPGSVQLNDVYFTRKNYLNTPMVCGYVNAKDAVGGYTGFQRCLSSGLRKTTFVEEQMSYGDFEKVWRTFCRR